MSGSSKGKLAIICIVIGLALVLGIGLVSCSGIASVGEIGANQAVADAAGGVVEDVDLPEAETEPIGQETHDDTGTERAESKPNDEATGHDEEPSYRGSAEDPQRQGSTVQSKGNSTAPPQNISQKTWVEETERVWVVDKEAWTESVPGTVKNLAHFSDSLISPPSGAATPPAESRPDSASSPTRSRPRT